MSNLGVRRILTEPHGELAIRSRAGAPPSGTVSLRTLLEGHVEVNIGAVPAWATWIGTETVLRLRTAFPRTLDELVWVVDHANRNDLRLRVPGAGHSTSAAARPDDLRVGTTVSGAENARWLKSRVDGRRHLTVPASTRVKTLNRRLLDDRGLALPNMGSFDGQTVAGALCTGTHGSSIHTGPMAESVRSVDLVVVENSDDGPRARAYRIEPTDGITDPAAFHRDRALHGMDLIQNDNTFYSSVVSFNAVGVIDALTIEVVDGYWLKEENSVRSWSNLKLLLEPQAMPGFDFQLPPLLAQSDFVEFLVNSAEVQHDHRDPTCLLRRRNRVPARSRPGGWEGAWPPRRVPSGLGQVFTETFVRPRIDNQSGSVLGAVDIGNSIATNFRNVAAQAPFEGGRHESRSHLVLRRERDDSQIDEAPEPPPEAISNEIAVPLEQTIEAVDAVLRVMRTSNHFYAVPFSVRFVRASKHYLAPQFGRPTTMIEVPMVLPNRPRVRRRDMPAFRDALEQIENELCYGTAAVGGRPHWGQYHTINRERLERLGYSRLATFETVRRRFNAGGTFDNRHTRQIGLGS